MTSGRDLGTDLGEELVQIVIGDLGQQRVWFVTRPKEGASFVTVEQRPVDGLGVRSDEVISFTSHARQEREFVFLTNHLELPAATIAELYRQRLAD